MNTILSNLKDFVYKAVDYVEDYDQNMDGSWSIVNRKKYSYRFHSGYAFLDEWCGYKNSIHGHSGVYMIGDFYIGSSGSIHSRVMNHFKAALNDNENSSKQVKSKILEELEKGNKIPV